MILQTILLLAGIALLYMGSEWMVRGSSALALSFSIRPVIIGVTVVVLAVNFMGAVFVGDREFLLPYGTGIALPIAALGLFVGLRAWSLKLSRQTAAEAEEWQKQAEGQGTPSQEAAEKAAGGE